MAESSDHAVRRLNHVAIAVPDLDAAAAHYREAFGCKVSAPQTTETHGVTVVYVKLENATIELMAPYGENSPIAKFLERNPAGGIHHIGVEVGDITAARDHAKTAGVRALGDGEPSIGLHGNPILFLHPKDLYGTLVELEQT